MSVELYLARRYLRGSRHGAWGWLISWITTGSVALGVAALIITLAVMTGFRRDITSKILGVQPHITLNSLTGVLPYPNQKIEAALLQEKGVVAWAPAVTGQVLLGRGPQNSGGVIRGVDPVKELGIADLKDTLVHGSWADLVPPTQKGARPRIFLGIELARNLGARVGDTVWIITPGSIGLSAFTVPQAHLFIVAGHIQSGLYDYDSGLAYTDLASAQALFGVAGNVSEIGIRVQNPDAADDIAADIRVKLNGDYWVHSWLSKNKNLFSALKLEKAVMFIILILITLVASFMIVSNLLLSIAHKVKEIGILRAMGASASVIRRTFLYQGLLMGAVGTSIGVALGTGLSFILAQTNLVKLPADVYYIDRLPVRLEFMDLVSVVAATGIIVFIASLYPAHRATKLDPLEAIRYG